MSFFMRRGVISICGSRQRGGVSRGLSPKDYGLNRDQYEQLMLTFSSAQRKLVVALAKERTREFDDEYRRRHLLGPSSTVNSAKRKLIEDGHVEQCLDGCTVADPFSPSSCVQSIDME